MSADHAVVSPAFDEDMAREGLARLFADAPGHLQIVHVDAGGRFRGAAGDVATIDAAVNRARRLDAAGSRGIYVRMSTLARPLSIHERGGAEDSLALPGLWADVDFGTLGHAHDASRHDGRPLPPDAAAAWRLVDESGLPTPSTWVHSGGGLYPWWLLAEPVILDENNRAEVAAVSAAWQSALAESAARLGWVYGTGVGNLDRVLRLPGSVNRKAGDARACVLHDDTGVRYTLDELRAALDGLPAAEPVRPPEPPPRAIRTTLPSDTSTVSAFDALDEHVSFDDLLAGAGWTPHRASHPPSVERCWTRPGGPENPCSAHTLADMPQVLVVWSESAGLPVGAGQRLTRGRLFAHLHHGGDERAASVDLFAAMAGRASTPAAASLPLPRRAPTTTTQSLVHASTTPPRPGEDEGQRGATDAERSEDGAGFDFWNRRPTLAHVRDFALARMVAPTAVFGCVLLRVAAAIPTHIVLPPTIGSVASLNLFVALVGPSGAGKGVAAGAAEDAFTWPTDAPMRANLGSGEGMAHAYAHHEGSGKSRAVVRDRESVMFELAEVDHFAAVTSRQGSTLDATIRSVYSGERLGSQNADPRRTLPIPAHAYRATLLMGVQPERARALFDGAAGGTPQRFVWLSAVSAEISENPPSAPDPLPLTLPSWPRRGMRPNALALPATVTHAIRAAHAARNRGEGDALDGHALLTRTKVAAVLAVLEGRLEVIDEDWILAGAVMAMSDRTREAITASLREVTERDNLSRGRREGARQAAAEDERASRTEGRVRAHVLSLVQKAGGAGTTRPRLNKALASRDRPLLEDALDALEAAGLILREDEQITPNGGR